MVVMYAGKLLLKYLFEGMKLQKRKVIKNMVSEIAKDFFYFQITYIFFVWIFGTGSGEKKDKKQKGESSLN